MKLDSAIDRLLASGAPHRDSKSRWRSTSPFALSQPQFHFPFHLSAVIIKGKKIIDTERQGFFKSPKMNSLSRESPFLKGGWGAGLRNGKGGQIACFYHPPEHLICH